MVLNIEKIGRPVAKVLGGRYNNKVVSVATNKDDVEELNRPYIHLNLDEGKFQQIPDTTANRQILYITGASGSGKSTYRLKYLHEYTKYNKNTRTTKYICLVHCQKTKPLTK